MELSFAEIIQGILERNPELGFQRMGENGIKYIHMEPEQDVPHLVSCEQVGKSRPVKTGNHGVGYEIELELVIGNVDSALGMSGLRFLTIGPVQPPGEASLLAAKGLGWQELKFDEEEVEAQCKDGARTVRVGGQVPFKFLIEGELARFQIQLTNSVGNMAVFFTGVPIHSVTKKRGGAEKKEDDDGDDPRDLPPPTIFGEEIDRDDASIPVYLVSDFHLGSNLHGNRTSNDMDAQTLERFIEFLQAAERDSKDAPYYDVVMNGDFLDLWQAKRPRNDNYGNRMQDIVDSNASFFAQLGNMLRRTPRCHFCYVIGNHDDPLMEHSDPDDSAFGPNDSYGSLRDTVNNTVRSVYESHLLPGVGRVWHFRRSNQPLSFTMSEHYTRRQYRMLAIHGHQFDDVNSRDSDGEPSDGQNIAEQINDMQENFENLRNIEYVPMHETAKLFKCMLDADSMSDDLEKAVEELKDTLVNADSGFLGDIADVFMSDSDVIDEIIEATEPDTVREDAREEAEDMLEDEDEVDEILGGSDSRPLMKILVTGHTHLEDLDPGSGEHARAYANTGSWFRRISARTGSSGCTLQVFPSDLPYVRISKEKGANKALVELNYFSGRLAGKLVKVTLDS